jgi:hypothetical protein
MASTETLSVPTTTSAVASSTSTAPKTPSRILFGSCSSQHYEQKLWPAIIHRNATAFVWGGDAIYGMCVCMVWVGVGVRPFFCASVSVSVRTTNNLIALMLVT